MWPQFHKSILRQQQQAAQRESEKKELKQTFPVETFVCDAFFIIYFFPERPAVARVSVYVFSTACSLIFFLKNRSIKSRKLATQNVMKTNFIYLHFWHPSF